jgi:hypothetical protein
MLRVSVHGGSVATIPWTGKIFLLNFQLSFCSSFRHADRTRVTAGGEDLPGRSPRAPLRLTTVSAAMATPRFTITIFAVSAVNRAGYSSGNG